MNLKGKVIVVTGGAKGIGRAIAMALSSRGARLAIFDLHEANMQEAVALITDAGGEARGYVCDVSDEWTVVQSFQQVLGDFGALHGLVNNAGIVRDGLLIKVENGRVVKNMSVADYDLLVNVHMKGAFLCAREAAQHMVESGIDEGCIVNIASVAYHGNYGQTNYSAAKAGMVAQSKAWAKELGRFNIRSMAVAPGTINTDLMVSARPDVVEKIVRLVPLNRVGEVGNVASLVQHIFENDYLSGTVIEVGGGVVV